MPLNEDLADLRDALLEIANDVVPMSPTYVRIREIAMKLDALAKVTADHQTADTPR